MFQATTLLSQTEPEYSFSDYSEVLKTDVYPQIQSYIQSLKPAAPTEEESKIIATDIFKLIMESFERGKFVSIIPPSVRVFKVSNNFRDVYVVEILITLLDGDASIKGKFVSSLLFGKRFIIYLDEKNKQPEVEV